MWPPEKALASPSQQTVDHMRHYWSYPTDVHLLGVGSRMFVLRTRWQSVLVLALCPDLRLPSEHDSIRTQHSPKSKVKIMFQEARPASDHGLLGQRKNSTAKCCCPWKYFQTENFVSVIKGKHSFTPRPLRIPLSVFASASKAWLPLTCLAKHLIREECSEEFLIFSVWIW